MSSKSFNVSVEPTVLVWARESIGMTIDEVAKKIKDTTAKTVKNWEKGKEKPTFAQIERLSFIYKRPLSAFLLSAPPIEPPFPTDFRTLSTNKKKPIH